MTGADRFAYDAGVPLELEERSSEERGEAVVRDVVYGDATIGRSLAFLAAQLDFDPG